MNTTIEANEMTLNGVKYVRADSIKEPKPNGNRCVVIVDRGWIYAGDVERKDGRILLTRALWVFNWSSVGFDGVLKNPKSEKVSLRKVDHIVDIPEASEIYCVHVDDNWGM